MRKLIVFFVIVILASCDRSSKQITKVNPEFGQFIAAYTTGLVSTYSTIKVRFNQPVSNQIIEDKDLELFDISPSIEGSISWIDNQTVEFVPSKTLEQDEHYHVTFSLYPLFENVPEDLTYFEFDLKTIKQRMAVEIEDVKTYDRKNLTLLKISGRVSLADKAELEKMEETITVEQSGRKMKVKWETPLNGNNYVFWVDSLIRTESASRLSVYWSGDPVNAKEEGEEKIEIPALGDFKVMNHKVENGENQKITIQFSDPLLENQDLRGLIQIEGLSSSLNYDIQDNSIIVQIPYKLNGNRAVTVHKGVKNVMSYAMSSSNAFVVKFEEIKPAVKLIGEGVIIPNSSGLIFPFEAVNLNAVDVKIVQVYENNVAQFLQVNTLEGTREMKRVGRIVYKGTVRLMGNQAIDLGKWNAFKLDLASLITPEPGAIYNVEISFRKSYSKYSCPDDNPQDDGMEELADNWDSWDEEETSGWDGIEDYYYDDYYSYDYSERDNPCNKAYYAAYGRKVSRNVFSSNLGIIVKMGSSRKMHISVSNILTTNPEGGVVLEVYNYQQQLMNSVTTNNEGFAEFDVKGVPYLLIAKKGNERGYVRLDNGSSLSLSMFDVSGNEVQKGLKGFLYGERGVWRPGDSLFLTFILEDKLDLIPDNHPVILELTSPTGQLYTRRVNNNPVNNFYHFGLATKEEDQTGNWMAKAKIGGTAFTKSLKIETIKPNRLKIAFDFEKEILTSGEYFSGKLNARWLHGATASNLSTDIKATLNATQTSFDQFSDYTFDDPTKRYETEEIELFDGALDESGNAKVSGVFHSNDNAPGMLKARFVTRVFENGGEFSIDQFSAKVSPYHSYVGLKMPKGDKARGMLLTDTTHTIQIASVNEEGTPQSRNNIKVSIYKISWQWWWENNAGNGLSSYIGNQLNNLITTGTTSTNSKGMGTFKFKIKYPDWGRYIAVVEDVSSGHSSAQVFYADWPGWAGRAQRENPGGAAMLSFSLDKEKYQVGETATITVPSSEGARALITLENGSRVLQAHWVDTEKEFTTYEVKVTEEMSPNVFVGVSVVQPHQNTANDHPIRLYGVMPMEVEDLTKKLSPEIKMPKVLRPKAEFTIAVSEKDKKSMTYTVAIVDEGLLGLTRFKTPNPYDHFYAKEALGVKTWDMYEWVMGALSGELSNLLATGGDSELANAKGQKAQRFKPVVKFLGPFYLGEGEKNTHKVTLPDYVGEVRTMIIAGDQFAYGATEQSTQVKKPLMVSVTAPRVIGPGETFDVPVTVFAMEESIKKVKAEITMVNKLNVVDKKEQSVTFKKTGDKTVVFSLKAQELMGVSKFTIKATSGNETAEQTIELDIRPANPMITKVEEENLSGGESKSLSLNLFGLKGTNAAKVELSAIPPIDLEKRLRYLLRYPHGCIEQTTSSVFPQLYLSNFVDLTEEEQTKASQNIKAGIEQLKSFQTVDGGFAYWPGQSDASSWGTSYALHFLLEAEKKGYEVPNALKSAALKYQRKKARNWSPNSNTYYKEDFIQGYRLFTLALAKKEELGSMNRLRESSNLSNMAKWKLAGAYYLAGKPEAADELLNTATKEVNTYQELSYTYGSGIRDKAIILEILTLQEKPEGIKTVMDQIAENLRSSKWMSTQTTAYALIGLSKFLDKNGFDKKLQAQITVGGEDIKVKTDKPVYTYEIKEPSQVNKLNIENKGKGTLFVRVITEGVPLQGKEEATSNGIQMSVQYKDANGNTLTPHNLSQGEDFKANVTISNIGSYGNLQELALTQIFPSGWEITNTRFLETQSGIANFEYQDIRDDRVLTYFDLPQNRSVTYTVNLHATYKGKYYLPAFNCEAMYDHTIKANNTGMWVEVK